MSAFSQFKTNDAVEKEGIWHDFGEFRVRLARAGGQNKKFARVLEAKVRPYNRAIKTETMDPDLQRKILAEVYAEVVITGWQCKRAGKWEDVVETAPDKFEPTSPATVLTALLALPDLFADLQENATKAALYRDDVREKNVGN